jgi:hypothetical protein
MKKWILVVITVTAFVMLLSPALAATRQYLIEDSSTRQLTESELWQWDYETLNYIYDEIMARHGYVFKSGEKYEEYFTQRPWYTKNASSDNQKYVYDKLTSLEWANYDLIKAVMQTMKDTNNFNTDGLNWRDVIGKEETTAASSTSISFVKKSFSADQKFDVYSAPGSSSYRGANGKACVSTNGPVYVAGWDGNWLLVMYDTNSGGVRVGYIRKSDISGSISASDLTLDNTARTLSRSATLTDDPVTGSTDIAQLSSGTQVTYLASYNNGTNWAYVETTVGGQIARGFIPANALN